MLRTRLARIEHLPLRGILLAALLVLGGWGGYTAVEQVSKNHDAYRQSQTVIRWAATAEQLFHVAQHFAFERGRTAVVLRDAQVISSANRTFIDQRRQQADAAMQVFLQKYGQLPQVGQEGLAEQWVDIRRLRKEVDRNVVLTRHERDPNLVDRWYDAATQFLMHSRAVTQKMAGPYARSNELELARLTLLAGYAFELRMVLGAESSLIAQQVAAKQSLEMPGLGKLHEMRGRQQALWQEIARLNTATLSPKVATAIADAKTAHETKLRPLQDSILNAWLAHREPEVALPALTGASQPTLDGISSVSQVAAEELARVALKRKEMAFSSLMRSMVVCGAILGTMSLAIWYVLRKVVKPLEALDQCLRHLLPAQATPSASRQGRNEIARLQEAAGLLEHLLAEKTRLEEELRSYAFQDTLTQLPNRRLLYERIEQTCLRSERRGTYAGLIFLDLDRFKQLNDSFGHEVGDHLLVEVAQRLKALFREEDTVARLGGDEFIVLVDDLGTNQDLAEYRADMINTKLRTELARPYSLGEIEFHGSASTGCKVFRGTQLSSSELVKAADALMYRAKVGATGGFDRTVQMPPGHA